MSSLDNPVTYETFNTPAEQINASIIGLGFVGGAMYDSFKSKGMSVKGYDKFKLSSPNTFDECLNTKVMFLCLPTQFDMNSHSYDKAPIFDTCDNLIKCKYTGVIVIKSTVEPGTTVELVTKYPGLKFIHNPEFLTAATALTDFNNQSHIVLGRGDTTYLTDDDFEHVVGIYRTLFPTAAISKCTSLESESMKIFANCFYASKIQILNEMYLLCQTIDCDYNTVISLMLKNGWINPMHTKIPGTDGQLSYGGYCFPKDTNALLCHMRKHNVPCGVLDAVVRERNSMRADNTNICQGNVDVSNLNITAIYTFLRNIIAQNIPDWT